MLSDSKVIEIFYMADDFCNFFNETVKKHSIEELCRAYSALIALDSSLAEITLTLHRLPAICNPHRVQVYLMKIIA